MEKQIEKIYSRPARPGMVGDGFRVYNYFPNAELTQKRVSPFLMLDFNAEYDLARLIISVGLTCTRIRDLKR